MNFYPSSPWLLGTGGAGNQLSLWDLSGEAPLRKRFGDRVATNIGAGQEEEEEEDNENEGAKEKDFEAMMAAGDAAAEKVREAGNSKKKKGGKKNKRKAHRAGR